MNTPPDPGVAAADSAPAASPLTAPEIRDDTPEPSRTPPRRGPSIDTQTTPRNPQGSGSAGAAGTPGGGDEDDAFGLAFRHALITARDEGWRDGYSVGYRAGYVDAHLADLTELAALRAELIAAKRDRDDWKRQAAALADRNAAYRDEIARAQGPFGYLEGRPDGNADARRGGVKP